MAKLTQRNVRVFVQRVHGGRWPVRAWTPRSPRRQAFGSGLDQAVRNLARKLRQPVRCLRLKETVGMSMPPKTRHEYWHLRDNWGYPIGSFLARYKQGDRVLVIIAGRRRFGTIVSAQLDHWMNFKHWIVAVRTKDEVFTVTKEDPNYSKAS